MLMLSAVSLLKSLATGLDVYAVYLRLKSAFPPSLTANVLVAMLPSAFDAVMVTFPELAVIIPSNSPSVRLSGSLPAFTVWKPLPVKPWIYVFPS